MIILILIHTHTLDEDHAHMNIELMSIHRVSVDGRYRTTSCETEVGPFASGSLSRRQDPQRTHRDERSRAKNNRDLWPAATILSLALDRGIELEHA